MRTDIEGWESYNNLVEMLVARAVVTVSPTPAATLDLWSVAEQWATRTHERTLALKYGDLNAAVVGLDDGSRFSDVTEQLGATGLLVDIAARAMVADAKRKPRWRAYLERNKDRWKSPSEPSL